MNILAEPITLLNLETFAQKLLPVIKHAHIAAFMGPLGSGKTTLIRALAHHMGITQPIVSPTFTYLSIYKIPDGTTLYHFDLYRLTSLTQFYDAGFNEYLNQPNSLVFVEWPELIRSLLPPTALLICLEYNNQNTDQRIIQILSP